LPVSFGFSDSKLIAWSRAGKSEYFRLGLISLFTLIGCQTGVEKSKLIIDSNGVSMISAKDASLLLGLTYSVENGSIVLKQDDIALKIKLGTPYVYKDGYILYMMEKPAISKNDIAYLPSSFFSEYFKVDIKSDEKKHLLITNSTDFSLYDIVQFLPEEVLEAINNKDYPNRDKVLKQVGFIEYIFAGKRYSMRRSCLS
jgi:hypothetical protein